MYTVLFYARALFHGFIVPRIYALIRTERINSDGIIVIPACLFGAPWARPPKTRKQRTTAVLQVDRKRGSRVYDRRIHTPSNETTTSAWLSNEGRVYALSSTTSVLENAEFLDAVVHCPVDVLRGRSVVTVT